MAARAGFSGRAVWHRLTGSLGIILGMARGESYPREGDEWPDDTRVRVRWDGRDTEDIVRLGQVKPAELRATTRGTFAPPSPGQLIRFDIHPSLTDGTNDEMVMGFLESGPSAMNEESRRLHGAAGWICADPDAWDLGDGEHYHAHLADEAGVFPQEIRPGKRDRKIILLINSKMFAPLANYAIYPNEQPDADYDFATDDLTYSAILDAYESNDFCVKTRALMMANIRDGERELAKERADLERISTNVEPTLSATNGLMRMARDLIGTMDKVEQASGIDMPTDLRAKIEVARSIVSGLEAVDEEAVALKRATLQYQVETIALIERRIALSRRTRDMMGRRLVITRDAKGKLLTPSRDNSATHAKDVFIRDAFARSGMRFN